MSRPRYYWYGYVQEMIRRYPDRMGESVIADIVRSGIESALEETERLPDGKERARLIRAYYMNGRYTLTGAAMECNVSIRTAQRWTSKFVYDVARASGYKI